MVASVRETSCPIRSSVSGQPCLLEAGHPADSRDRFHRYAAGPEVVFAFADPARRTWVALNRAGDGYHFVHPAPSNDLRVTGLVHGDGTICFRPLTAPGALVCECSGGRYRGTCHVVTAALRALALYEIETAPDPSLGAGASVEAYRG